ncbi:MAG: ribonuclease E activity regulator RraA [Anaerolineales bacterium]|nr:ribonuclease E activity regulator RraA [Anaerolineales bacterium]
MTNPSIVNFATPDLADAYPDAVRVCALPFQDFGGRTAFAGQIRTVVCYEDNQLVKQVIQQPGNGGILVVDGGGSPRRALLGDLNAALARDNGWSGLVINGVIRDAALIGDIDLGVKALGVTPLRSSKTGAGAIDVPVVFGDALFEPGDWLYCDRDGVLVAKAPLSLAAASE